MAKGRMISISLSTSARRARLNDVAGRLAEFCQAIYPLMVVHADDFGRHPGDPFTVKHVVDPTSRRTLDEFARALTFLDDVGLIHWYDVDGRWFYEIVDFDLHQGGLHKRTKSKFPEFPGSSGKFREFPAERNRTELNPSPTPPGGRGSRRRSLTTDAEADHIRRSQEVKRLVMEEGLTIADASRRLGYT